MEVVANNYLPGDQRLVDKIVYELKSQGIFDQFRKECFSDVDTKPAYQNLRQRVEGSVTGFLKGQSWRPDMNKNQVREMLRKTITESGFLETGVERIVDQVVNPKINTVFLPKVEEVVYSHLGLKKPNSRSEVSKSDQIDLLPTDLEAVSPESEPVDKRDDKSTDNIQELEESKTEEDESPPFEPLDEQSLYVAHEENSVDSHLSGFSGLISHESNQSNEHKVSQVEQDSQMSRNSSDSRLSIVTSDENSKMDLCEDSQSKSIKSIDSNHKFDSNNKNKSSERHKSRSESKSDKDKRSSKDSKSRYSSSSKSHDRKDSKSTSKNDKDRSKDKDRKSSNNKHGTSSSKDKTIKKESRSDKDKSDKGRSSGHKDSKPRDKSSDSKSKDKSSSSDKHKHSSSSHNDKHKKDKDRKKDAKSKDDHYSSKDKKNDRRSTDRDSNDGHSSRHNFSSAIAENNASQSQKSSQNSTHNSGDSGNSEQVETTTRAPIIITGAIENSEITIASPETQRVKVFKPKCASNIQEALRLMKIRKQLARLEKQNQLSLASVDITTPILLSSSINLEDLNHNGFDKNKQEDLNSKMVAELEIVPSPLQNTVISQDNWDAMEAKLRQEVCKEFNETSPDDTIDHKIKDTDDEACKYFDKVDIRQIEFLQFVDRFVKRVEKYKRPRKGNTCKRKSEDTDLKNNNKKLTSVPDKKRKINRKISNIDVAPNEKFSLPLSPAESDKSVGKKDETVIVPLRTKRNSISKASNQRYSSDDLYKPRPTFTSSRRRGAKNLEN